MVEERDAGRHVAANDDDDDSDVDIEPVIVPSSTRHSMDEYYQQEEDVISQIAEAPPAYDTLLESPVLRRKFNIQPREDEGREILPPYSSAISIQNVFMKKMELEGAVNKAQDRNWYRVMVTLQGTALTFHKFKGSAMFSKDDGGLGGEKPNSALSLKKGTFLRSYSLQHADVGVAADYVKKRFVIRVRAEADQFLLSCNKIETFVLWLQSLFAAIDLAPPLDDREIPRDLSIPRRVRRRARAGFGDAQLNANLVREQQEIIATHFPQLATDDAAEDDAAIPTNQAEIETIAEETESSSTAPSPIATTPSSPRESMASLPIRSGTSTPPIRSGSSTPRLRSMPSSAPPTEVRTLLSRARQAVKATATTNFATAIPNPSITSDGKWRPQHQWTHFYDMLYAKRCMAILTHRSPRKSNLVIMMGKQWVVDWATGKLERCQPPDYMELEGKEYVGGMGRPVVSLVRVQ